MKSEILEIVNKKHTASNGSCGTYFMDFVNQLGVSATEFEKTVTEMYNDDLLDIRTGIHGPMVMKKV